MIMLPQRQSNNDLQAFFAYDERKKFGTERPFNACCICLQPVIDPLSCNKGHLFCKECIFQCLLAQKKSIKRKLASFTNQEKPDKDVEDDRDTSQDADPRIFDDDDNNNNSSSSRSISSYEEEALRNMRAFWLPSAAPGAEAMVDLQQRTAVHQTPSFDTYCPEGNEKLKLKDLFQIVFLEEDGQDHVACPSCSVKLTSAVTLVAISTCGHLFCKKCADHVGKGCLVCDKPCKAKNLVVLERSGFSGRHEDDGLEASSFTCVGSGNEGVVA